MVSLIITIVIFCLIEFTASKVEAIYLQKKQSIQTENKEITKKEEIVPKKYEEPKEQKWEIEIPKIDLIAPISEGTSQEVMLEYVGHFEHTNLLNGNVGLAAHNRGYPINYFSRLKELEFGDEIIYKQGYETQKYVVNNITIIQDTNWSYLQDTEENTITLITCVENKPTQRRCIQGIEIKEEF